MAGVLLVEQSAGKGGKVRGFLTVKEETTEDSERTRTTGCSRSRENIELSPTMDRKMERAREEKPKALAAEERSAKPLGLRVSDTQAQEL